jgi:hypothetical protein
MRVLPGIAILLARRLAAPRTAAPAPDGQARQPLSLFDGIVPPHRSMTFPFEAARYGLER